MNPNLLIGFLGVLIANGTTVQKRYKVCSGVDAGPKWLMSQLVPLIGRKARALYSSRLSSITKDLRIEKTGNLAAGSKC